MTVRDLRDLGWDVRGVDIAPGEGTTTIGDVTGRGASEEAFAGTDLVVHAAAVVEESGDRSVFERVNVVGTRNVMEAAADAGVARAVHLSSIVVFGADFPDGVDETAPVRMTGAPYTDSKVAAEHQALAVAATRPEATGEILTITGGVGVTVRRFFSYYAEATGIRLVGIPAGPLRAVLAALRAATAPVGLDLPIAHESIEYLTHPGTYSVAKAERLLGWRPSVDLEEGMRRTLAWARDEGLV